MKTLVSLFAGFFAGVIFLSLTVLAAGGIQSVSVNDNKISYNGRELDLGGESMISIVQEGTSYAENYIPMRRTLEEMGFNVEWDASQNAVVIKGY